MMISAVTVLRHMTCAWFACVLVLSLVSPFGKILQPRTNNYREYLLSCQRCGLTGKRCHQWTRRMLLAITMNLGHSPRLVQYIITQKRLDPASIITGSAAHSCRNHAWSENILEWSSCACTQDDFHLKYLCPIMGHLASLH